MPDWLAKTPEQRRQQEKPHTARDGRADRKRGEVKMKGPAGNRNQLIGNWRGAFDDDQPRTPLIIEQLELAKAVGRPIEAQQWLADLLEREIAYSVTEEAAQH